MKTFAIALILALSAIACDTPPDIGSSPPSADAGVQALEQAQKITPIPGLITPPGVGASPIDDYCSAKYYACLDYCHALYRWSNLWVYVCYAQCDFEREQCY